MANRYDVVVVGGGPGGYVAAVRSAQLGLKTACVDKGSTLGGTCLNVGCIPSKALLHSSLQYDFLLKHAKEHGMSCEAPHFDFGQMMTRKDGIVTGLVQSVEALLKKHKIDWLHGTGKVVGPNSIRIGEETFEAGNIILATGSESIALPFLPFDEKKVVSSTGALSLQKVPEKLIVVGAGVIGVELASVYNRLGSQVTVVEMLDSICPAMDHTISRTLLTSLKKQGITFHLAVKVVEGAVTDQGVNLGIEIEGKKETFTADVVLVAVGRRPYTKGLGLHEIGVAVSNRGFVTVDGLFRTSIPSIYAIGDLVEGVMLAHRASDEGIAVAEIIAGQRPSINYMAIPNVIYTHPEVAAVGLTEKEAKEAGMEVMVGSSLIRGNARARCVGDTDGVVKVVGDKRSGRVVGLHIACANASEMIGEGVMAIVKRLTVEEVANASHAHPTLSEAIKEACQQVLGRAIHV